ncbi:hypothetical protein ACFSTC_47720 [Nonomuraea ferruginea]
MLDQPGVGPHLSAGSPVVVDGEQGPPRPAPSVGQHTGEVLREELGYSAARLAALRDQGRDRLTRHPAGAIMRRISVCR